MAQGLQRVGAQRVFIHLPIRQDPCFHLFQIFAKFSSPSPFPSSANSTTGGYSFLSGQGSGNKSLLKSTERKSSAEGISYTDIQITTPLSTPLPSGGESGSVCQSQTSQDSVNWAPPQSLGYLSLLHSLKLQIQIGPSRPQWCPVAGKKKNCAHKHTLRLPKSKFQYCLG